jgi:hypothetical protein
MGFSVAAQNKYEKGQMPKSVNISEMEYNSLKAAAELVRYPDVLMRTLDAVNNRQRAESVEDAFSQPAGHSSVRASHLGGGICEV